MEEAKKKLLNFYNNMIKNLNNKCKKSFFYKREHPDIRYLEEAMIIVMRAKYLEYNYSLNTGVVENLNRLFSKENKEIAKRYGEIEHLTIGMLYSYK